MRIFVHRKFIPSSFLPLLDDPRYAKWTAVSISRADLYRVGHEMLDWFESSTNGRTILVETQDRASMSLLFEDERDIVHFKLRFQDSDTQDDDEVPLSALPSVPSGYRVPHLSQTGQGANAALKQAMANLQGTLKQIKAKQAKALAARAKKPKKVPRQSLCRKSDNDLK